MRWVLPGGAVLRERSREGEEREVACRPHAAVLESIRPKTIWEQLVSAVKRFWSGFTTLAARIWRWLITLRPSTVKQWLEVLVVLVGLIGAILALFGLSRK
jgi:hypothetical protein